MVSPASGKELIFVADPMCSWCWGFAPTISAIRRDFGKVLDISLVVGGLRPGTTDVMSTAMKSDIRHHWEHVYEASGQPFDFDFFRRDDFVYDTEPACRAIVSVRELKPDAALDFLATLHQSFYAENKDITNSDILAGLAGEAGLDVDQFRQYFISEKAKKKTVNDFQYAHGLGVTGFPTIVARDGAVARPETGNPQANDLAESQYAYLTVGYRPYQALEPLLREWVGQATAPA